MAALEIVALDTTTPQLRAPGTGDTYSAPRALALTPETLTGSAATSGLSVTQTWNTTGTPTALKLDVTDTASNASSLLMDLRVGGSSKFYVGKTGRANVFDLNCWDGDLLIYRAGTLSARSSTTRFSVPTELGFSNNNPSSPDVYLARDAANTLALRNSANAQTFNTYGLYVDASNYRRVALAMTFAGVTTLKPEGAGIGASGNVLHISGLPTSNPGPGILWNNAGTPAIGT